MARQGVSITDLQKTTGEVVFAFGGHEIWMEVKIGLLTGGFNADLPDMTVDDLLHWLADAITDWNLTDAAGEKLPITYGTLDRELPRALSPWAMVRAAAQWRAPLERE